jgi:hypothetical protein
VGPLTNGINVIVQSRGEIIFTAVVRQLSDILTLGGIVENKVDDGTDTHVTVGFDLDLTTPVVLDFEEDDEFELTVNDNLSGLIFFNVIARGFQIDKE